MHPSRQTLRFSLDAASRLRHVEPAVRRLALLTVKQQRYNSTSTTLVISQLGLRSQLPPDSSGYQASSSSSSYPQEDPKGKQKQTVPEPDEISDAEWELRTGRAIYTLQQTLPDFFNVGLVSCLEEDQVKRASLSNLVRDKEEGGMGIYSSKIRLSYTPPVALPAPLPQTIHIEGLPLYMTSSVFIRHTLNALYSDLQVTLTRLSSSPCSALPKEDRPDFGLASPGALKKPRKKRDKSFAISLSVIGTSRVTGTKGQWDIKSTYTFSPISGLVLSHVVDEIDPAPHRAAYEALGMGMGLAFGTSSRVGCDTGRVESRGGDRKANQD